MHAACKAFVISPIGEPGSPERVHADWVLDRIIRQACARVASEGIVVHADRFPSMPDGPATSWSRSSSP